MAGKKAKFLPSNKGWPADNVERRAVSDLIPYAKNSRTHSDEQVNQIAASIREWGWTVPVLIGEDGTIIAGHGRILAAQKLGIDEVPVMIADGWTDAQKRAYAIADNKLALNAGWDLDMLETEFKGLADDGFDLELTGFDDSEIADFVADKSEGLTDEDAVPDAPERPVTVEGDVWLLGGHRLMCGDSTSINHLECLCDGQLVDMWLTDPPYNVSYEGKTKDALKIQNDKMEDDLFRQFLRDAYVAADSVMKAGAVFLHLARRHGGV